MHLDLLKEVLAVPTCSGRERKMLDFLVNPVRDGGTGLRGTLVPDEVEAALAAGVDLVKALGCCQREN